MSEGEHYDNQKEQLEEGYEEEDQYIQGRYDQEYVDQEGYENEEMYGEEEKMGEGYEEEGNFVSL